MATSDAIMIRFQYANRMAPSVYKALSAKGATRRHWRVLSNKRWEIWDFSKEAWSAAQPSVQGFFGADAVIERGERRGTKVYWERIR